MASYNGGNIYGSLEGFNARERKAMKSANDISSERALKGFALTYIKAGADEETFVSEMLGSFGSSDVTEEKLRDAWAKARGIRR